MRGYLVLPGELGNPEDSFVDRIDLRQRTRKVPAQHFNAAAADHSAGVGGIVGRIENVPLPEHISMASLQQLIVSCAHHHLHLELWKGGVIQYPAQSAGRKDVRL